MRLAFNRCLLCTSPGRWTFVYGILAAALATWSLLAPVLWGGGKGRAGGRGKRPSSLTHEPRVGKVGGSSTQRCHYALPRLVRVLVNK